MNLEASANRESAIEPSAIGPQTNGYRLDPLTSGETANWDALIEPYHGREVFHRTAWLDYLAASRGLDILRWAIRDGEQAVGYFCGGIFRLGPFRILGSPLRSWGTNFMGPVMDRRVDQARVLNALDNLAQQMGLAMIELEHPMLSEALLRARGYEPTVDWTYQVWLHPTDPEAMWRSLDSTCRNRIRKAEASGLSVEDTDDPAVADEYFDLFLELMRRKGRRPPFGREAARLLFYHLRKNGSLFALRVRDAEKRLLAVGLFPHDDRAMYFWSGASREDAHALCPNDLLHWTAMRIGAERGLTLYNMSGHGRFKRKFGGTLTELTRWHKCYWSTARLGRKAYHLWFETRTRLNLSRLRLLMGRTAARKSTASSARNSSKALAPTTLAQRPDFRPSDIYRAPLHDFPIRDEILYQYLPLTAEMHLLEIGPGSGFTAFRLARRVQSLTLLDIAPGNIARLRQELRNVPNLSFVCADVCQPGLATLLDRTFDAVFAIEVLEFLPDPGTCLQNLAAVTRPGGYVLLQFPNYPPSQSSGPTHFRTRVELERLLAGSGFSSWSLAALRLRSQAAFLYKHFHEKPLGAYRRQRQATGQVHSLTYDGTWAFRHGHRLEPFKYTMHSAWTLMSAVMRLCGPAFEHWEPGKEILNQNLIVLALR